MSLRPAARLAALVFCGLATAYCGEQGKFTTGTSGDVQAPVSSIVLPGGPADTLVLLSDSLKFTAQATDNIRVASMKVSLKSLDSALTLDTVLLDTTTSTGLSIQRAFAVPLTVADVGHHLGIIVASADAAGHKNTDTARVFISAADTIKPTITFVTPTVGLPITVGDSVLVRVRVRDNLGVTAVTETGIAHRGVDSLGTGHDVTRYTLKSIALAPADTDTTFSRYLQLVPADSTVELVSVIVTAQDSTGNTAIDTVPVQIVGGPHVAMVRPTAGASTAPGKSVTVEVDANKTSSGVLIVGYATSGVYVSRDSIVLTPTSGALPDTFAFVKSFTIPAGTPNGPLTFTPFAQDSIHNVSGISPTTTITVSSAVVVSVPPTITYTVGRRVETGDTITIEASSQAGIGRVGFTARLLDGTLLSSDSTVPALNGTLSDYTQKFSLKLPGPPTLRFPAQIVVQPFANDSGLQAGGRAVAVAETLTVVAGNTYALPAGSQISDAIYNKNRNELYLANTALDRIEVFDLASSSFVGYIPVGSRPSSLALFPRDSLGNYRDTLIVANSGGTNLSVVDLATRREMWRQRLPNYEVETVKTQTNAGGGVDIITTPYEFSDRPFQIGAMCVTGASARCDRVRVLYSTTPTLGQTGPFSARGYLAWVEIDTAGTQGLPVHFIYEHSASGQDTLQIVAIRDTMPGQFLRDTILSVGVGRLVTISTLPFQDSTFVRNSGDALHSLVGEGGVAVSFARALTYDARPGLVPVTGSTCVVVTYAVSCTGFADIGVSPLVQVSDFVTNRSSRVTAVAINYNGRTNLVRADSIYAFDYTLRQTGMMQISAANGAVGMDFHPLNAFDAATKGSGGAGYQNSRLVFAARPDSSLDVFDTYFYGEATDTTSTASTIPIPIRNALAGPVRVAATGTSTIMFGFTAHGLVVVDLPTVSNSLFPTRRPVAPPPSSVQRLPASRALTRRTP